jgi:signal transduction histidine kinase
MLRARLFLNLLPFVVILVAVGVYAIALFSRLAESVETTVKKNYQSITAAQAMRLSLAGMEREVWGWAVGQSPTNAAFKENQKLFEKNLSTLLDSTSLAEQKEPNQQLTEQYGAFKTSVATLLASGKAETLHQVYEQSIVPGVLRMEVVLAKIQQINERAIMATSQNIQNVTREVTRLMIAGIIVALVISAYASYQLSRSILQPIESLTQATRELGEGKLDKPVPVVSRDELGELAGAFNKMAAQLSEYRQSTSEELVRMHRTMETTLASFPDPIFVLNREGNIELRNPAAQSLLSGLGREQLPDRLRAIAGKTLQTGENFLPHSFNEAVWYRVHGEEKFFLPRVLAMRNKEEALSGVAVVLYDVTRFRLLDAAKTNLVATVSHELKTPLTSVRMALHILCEKIVGSLTPKQEELAQAARNDAERLLRILNDLLDLARLDEGNADLRREPAAPADLLQAAAQDMAEAASLKGLKLTWSADQQLPQVSVDRQRISHVFSNFITNAIKHSPAGGEIRLSAALAENHDVQFSVSDQGPGIPEEYQTRIFDRFFRVPGQTKTGAGLGLSVAREITVAHGGRIGVKSALGKGSTFFVILQAAESG